jgi:hypothetical protein
MEPDKVRSKEAGEDLLPPGEVAEDLERREGDVVEIPDLGIRQALPEHLREEHQVVVVDPDGVVGPGHLHHGVAELLVHPLVDLPRLRIVVCMEVEVVEERPEGVVAEPVVVVLDVIRGEEDRVALLFCEHPDNPIFLFFLILPDVYARPADPEALVGLVERANSRGKTADAPLQVEVAVLAGNTDRKPV